MKGYYPSESKGLVKISSMNDYHIRRALLKRSKDYFTEIFDKDDTNTVFLKKFAKMTEDQIVVDLYTELAGRK
jgi:MarR-like DNA-binding transcriptional regulator SgrR of sgrS sRNA